MRHARVCREADSEAAIVPQEVVQQDVVVGAHERPEVEMWSERGHAAVVGAGARHHRSERGHGALSDGSLAISTTLRKN